MAAGPTPTPDGGSSWTLESWVDALSAALGIDTDVPVDTLLDSTRDVAHQVARPAAPLTLYLVGFAVAQRGGGPDDVVAALDTVRELIAREAAAREAAAREAAARDAAATDTQGGGT
jgi:hypothetical protein